MQPVCCGSAQEGHVRLRASEGGLESTTDGPSSHEAGKVLQEEDSTQLDGKGRGLFPGAW